MKYDVCLYCSLELFNECLWPKEIDGELFPCGVYLSTSDKKKDDEKNPVGRPLSNPEDVTDPLSTGRKRAKALTPVFAGAVCAWAGLRFAGGGSRPIIGCAGNQVVEAKKNDDVPPGMYRVERHHGPDKNVLNNSVGVNLHVICSACHERWHQLNNPTYSGEAEDRRNAGKSYYPQTPYWPHDPDTLAEERLIDLHGAWWLIRPEQRPPYPFETPAKAPITPPPPAEKSISDEFVMDLG